MSEFQDQERQAGPAAGIGPAAAAWEQPRRQMFDPRRKSPFLASLLSVVPGIGQVYIGYYLRGFATAAVFLVVVMIGMDSRGDFSGILMMSAIFVWIFNLIDAGRMAALYNHAAAGNNAIAMPSDLKLPRLGGSIMGGVLLLLFGSIALSYTAFGYPLDWLERWWPVFPLALGAWLLLRGVMDAMGAHAKESEPTS